MTALPEQGDIVYESIPAFDLIARFNVAIKLKNLIENCPRDGRRCVSWRVIGLCVVGVRFEQDLWLFNPKHIRDRLALVFKRVLPTSKPVLKSLHATVDFASECFQSISFGADMWLLQKGLNPSLNMPAEHYKLED